jgi:hypothetical protein
VISSKTLINASILNVSFHFVHNTFSVDMGTCLLLVMLICKTVIRIHRKCNSADNTVKSGALKCCFNTAVHKKNRTVSYWCLTTLKTFILCVQIGGPV